jgi:hypothetical protein
VQNQVKTIIFINSGKFNLTPPPLRQSPALVLNVCTLISTLITLHIHQKKEIAPKIAAETASVKTVNRPLCDLCV